MTIEADEVLRFWFEETEQKQRFSKDPKFDALITERFGTLHARAVRSELWNWRTRPEGRLAECIVLDQFSRNIYRDFPLAFAQDPLALGLAQEGVRQGIDQKIEPVERRAFFYMPYMHSESAFVHEEAIRLFSQPGLEGMLSYEHMHKQIIDRFGRYPHRNAVLGRKTTPQEAEFLKEQNSSF